MKTVQEIGKKGGQTTCKLYGKDHFKKLARRRWKKHRAKKKSA